MSPTKSLTRFAWLSIAAALLTIGLKTAAYWLTGSVGLLSDALESGVNLVAAVIALIVLTVAAQPPDDEHTYGHAKAEYFAGGVEGTLILIAAATIAISAVDRLLHPQQIEQVGVGLAVSFAAGILNLVVAQVLTRAGRHYRSITLMADAQHLMTDVYTSAGVLAAVAIVAVTGWQALDPIIALLVAANIIRAGIHLVRGSVLGLMDTSLPVAEIDAITEILDDYVKEGIHYHALRTRESGRQRFMSVHIQVPGDWTVLRGHNLLELFERDVRRALAPITVFTHLEPIEDPSSWEDISIFRATE